MKEIDLPAVNPQDYTYAGFYDVTPFNAWFWAGWYDPELASEIGLDISNPGYIVVAKGHVYPSNDTYKEIRAYVEEKLKNDEHDFAEDLRKKLDSAAADLISFVALADADDTPRVLPEIARRFRQVTFYWAVGYFAGVTFEETLKAAAEERGLDPAELTDLVGRPETHTYRRQKDVRRLRKLVPSDLGLNEAYVFVQTNEDVKAAFMKHLNTYGWIGMTGFFGAPVTLDTLIDEALSIREEEISPDAGSLGAMGEVAKTLLYLNQTGAELFQIVGWKSLRFIDNAAAQLGVSRDDVFYLTPEEIFHAGAAAPDALEKITLRKGGEVAFYYGEDRRAHIVDDPTIAGKIREAFRPELLVSKDPLTLTGRCGNKGFARGTARVIMGRDEFLNMNKGDILITSMTTPDFVPLMQKASAIVTDMGGILSHAVIMSRELGKPCVIGTQRATQVFKDGDMVEVDADEGIVRKIEK